MTTLNIKYDYYTPCYYVTKYILTCLNSNKAKKYYI